MSKKLIDKIFFTLSDGSKWSLSAMIIAHSRAAYYATLDAERGDGEYDEIYHQEIMIALTDWTELFDWLVNNMVEADIVPYLIKEIEPNVIDLGNEVAMILKYGAGLSYKFGTSIVEKVEEIKKRGKDGVSK
ncbi:MAG TPA: hypothetical protein ENH85_12410 [Candidatus Scalindua sp.]|nr:hypothetical protein [Candidatus Scalindua sp.]